MMHGNWFGNGDCPLWGGFNTFSFWHILMMVGFLVLIVGLVAMFRNKKMNSNDALEILKVEYARGSMDEEEYLKRKEVLNRK